VWREYLVCWAFLKGKVFKLKIPFALSWNLISFAFLGWITLFYFDVIFNWVKPVRRDSEGLGRHETFWEILMAVSPVSLIIQITPRKESGKCIHLQTLLFLAKFFLPLFLFFVWHFSYSFSCCFVHVRPASSSLHAVAYFKYEKFWCRTHGNAMSWVREMQPWTSHSAFWKYRQYEYKSVARVDYAFVLRGCAVECIQLLCLFKRFVVQITIWSQRTA